MKQRFALVVLVAIAALAAIGMYLRFFPGRLIFISFDTIITADKFGERIFDSEPFYKRTPYYCFTVSPDECGWAYLDIQNDELALLRTSELPNSEPIKRYKNTGGIIDLSKYHIPYCYQSNLSWSPDGKSIAYASNDTLYIVNLYSRQVLSGKIPSEPKFDKLERIWKHSVSKYRVDPAAVASEANQFRREVRSIASKSADKNLNVLLSSDITSQMSEIAYFNDSTPLNKQTREELDKEFLRVRNQLHLEIIAKQRLPYCRSDLAIPKDLSSDKGFFLLYKYKGRSITWTSRDTIYCDNWKLKVKENKSGLKVMAIKTPLLVEPLAHPVWSVKGDKAAYLLMLRDVNRRKIMNPAKLIIVDAKGKVLSSQWITAYEDCLQWSSNGEYIATRNGDLKGSYFDIYNVNTLRHWKIRIKNDHNLVSDHSAWDYID